MAKQMPKYMIEKIEKMNAAVYKAQELAEEIEAWIEENGISDDGYDYVYSFADSTAYSIANKRFVRDVNSELAWRDK